MKLDGYRMLAAIAGDQVRLYTRNGHDWTRQFGYVAPALSRLTRGTALIDGELVAIDERGPTDFTLLKNSLDGKKPVVFYAFDLLEQDGGDITLLPQLERKQIHYSPMSRPRTRLHSPSMSSGTARRCPRPGSSSRSARLSG